MKLKTDFVTNSSSTNFIVMSKGELMLQPFLKAVGITTDSHFVSMFTKLFSLLINDMEPIEYYARRCKYYDVDNFIQEYFNEDIQKRIYDALAKGYKIYVGSLASDNGEVECLFCCDSFVIKGKDFIIDATENEW